MAYLLADERLNPVIIKLNRLLLDSFRTELLDFSGNMTTGKLKYKKRRPSGSIFNHKRVSSPFIPERSIGLKPMSLGAFPHSNRVEICAFQEDVGSLPRHPGILSAEHTCKAHRLFIVSYHQVSCGQCPLHSVKSNEFLAFSSPAHNDFSAVYL